MINLTLTEDEVHFLIEALGIAEGVFEQSGDTAKVALCETLAEKLEKAEVK